MANDFKVVRNLFRYNGFMSQVKEDRSEIMLELNGVDVIFFFGAGGETLMDVDVHVYPDKHEDLDPDIAVEED